MIRQKQSPPGQSYETLGNVTIKALMPGGALLRHIWVIGPRAPASIVWPIVGTVLVLILQIFVGAAPASEVRLFVSSCL